MAYTRINWQDGESGGTPLSAENLNKMDEGINNVTGKVDRYVGLRYDGQNLDGFKDWLVNTATGGSYLVTLGLNGAISCAIVQKANVNYLSFIHFNYGVTAKQYKYLNGTWTEVSL